MVMKIVSWNVNGINALLKKEDSKFFKEFKADIYCLQEMKATKDKMPEILVTEGYESYHAIAEKKGYSGVTTISRIKPLSVMEGIGEEKFDCEGRVLTLEFPEFFLINAYFPNAQPELARIKFKIEFNKKLEEFAEKLRRKKGVIITGDFNVAHKEIDLKNPKANENNAGFSPLEREWIDRFLKNGWIDTFRMFNKNPGQYTWWSYRFRAREKGIGWRIDYFIVSKDLKKRVVKSEILSNIFGSDHCPILLELK
ncbi:exodeoxyribonuclease III [Candidatus Pacearchaeota archaeon]|nr:MAG: exodeoxyribonuclease III [Candidatus Pacearchaeota archaeon]